MIRVIATVCSKCAERLPVGGDRRPAVGEHFDLPACRRSPSARSRTPCPRAAAGRGPGLPKFGQLRRLVHGAADAVADEVAHHREARRLDALLHRGADVAEPLARRELLGCRASSDARVDLAAGGATRRRPRPTATVSAASPWKPSQIAPKSSFSRSPSTSAARAGNAVHDLLVHRRAQHRGERRRPGPARSPGTTTRACARGSRRAPRGRARAVVTPGFASAASCDQDLADVAAGLAHLVELALGLDLDHARGSERALDARGDLVHRADAVDALHRLRVVTSAPARCRACRPRAASRPPPRCRPPGLRRAPGSRRRSSSSATIERDDSRGLARPASRRCRRAPRACGCVRGKPSSTKPFLQSGRASRWRTISITTSSGTRSPRSMIALARLPISEPDATASRRMSPVEICGMPEPLAPGASPVCPSPSPAARSGSS